MNHPYLPLVEQERQEILQRMNLKDMESLLESIPQPLREKAALAGITPLPEHELLRHFRAQAGKNRTVNQLLSFLGAGAYRHARPAALDALVNRSEFLTAYTPYQPEMSQGLLQSIFEFQTCMSELTGLPVANASLYDGPTALAEGILLAAAHTGRKRVLLSAAISPQARRVAKVYGEPRGLVVEEVPYRNGETDYAELERMIDDETALAAVANPNFFGCVEDLPRVARAAREKGALALAYIPDPISLAVLTTPGEAGFDLAVGEAQSLGLPLQYGGPYLGFITARQELLRRLPGRIVGKTRDREGRPGYVLTLQAREQHIRREKATSNICSNEALCALTATIYLSLLGPQGLRETAKAVIDNSHYLHKSLKTVKGVEFPFTAPFYQEFVVSVPHSDQVLQKLLHQDILAGYPLGKEYPELKDGILIAATEVHTLPELDRLTAALKEALV